MPNKLIVNRRTILKASAGLVSAPAVLRRAYAADTFKVGLVSPTTGPLAGFGEAQDWVIAGLKDAMGKLPDRKSVV